MNKEKEQKPKQKNSIIFDHKLEVKFKCQN